MTQVSHCVIAPPLSPPLCLPPHSPVMRAAGEVALDDHLEAVFSVEGHVALLERFEVARQSGRVGALQYGPNELTADAHALAGWIDPQDHQVPVRCGHVAGVKLAEDAHRRAKPAGRTL